MTNSRRTGFVFASLAVLATSIAGVVAATSTVAQATPVLGSAFTCMNPTYYLSQTQSDGNRTAIYYATASSGSVAFTTLNSASWADTYNALGFDPNNNYLYATVLGPVQGHPDQTGNTLLQIGSDGVAISLGTIIDGTSDLPVPNQTGPADGAFDAAGNYWVTWGNNSSLLYEINVNSSPPEVIRTVNLSQPWGPIDFSLSGGYMWGLGNEDEFGNNLVYRLDLATGTVTTYSAPSQIKAGAYGAAWTFTNGNLGFSNNGTGDIYQVSISSPSTPTFSVVSHYTGPVADQSNDGAACVAPMTTDLSIVKTGPATVTPGGTITWTLTVTNTGPGGSSGFGVSDNVPAGVTNVATSTAGCVATANDVLCSEGALANGGTFAITITGKAPTTLGTCVDNTATVTANETDPNTANNTSTWETCVPGITIVKSANPLNFSSPGTVITYGYQVTNDSTKESLTNVTVSDNKLGAITCPDSTLTPSQTETCTSVTYTTTQADVDAGGVTNTATATGTPPTGPNLTGTSTVTVTASQSPAFTLIKSADISGFAAPGTAVHYSYKVTNSGNVTLTNVTVSDPMRNLSAINCGSGTNVIASMAVGGAPVTCSATYTTTQADVDAGGITNTGTAIATPPSGGSLTQTSSVDIPATQVPIISVVKSASESTYAAGDHVTYTYTVTNTGNVTLTNVTVSDNKLGSITCPGSTLGPSASETCTTTYTTTQADVDAGSITNTGTARGTPPTGSQVTDTSTLTITSAETPGITVTKTAGIPSFSAPGTLVNYMYGVTNTGNVTLTNITVSDPMHGLSSISCPVTSLAPGAAEICTASYTTTQGDVDAGSLTNTGTVTATTPTGSQVTNTSTLTIPAHQNPGVTVTKSASITSFSSAGTAVTYTYDITDTGNVTLTSVGVTDPMHGLSTVTCPASTLAPGASETCTASYTTTQGDMDAGSLTNTGTATATTPTGSQVTNSSTLTIPAHQNPGVTVTKSASVTSFSSAGTPVTYEYVVTNTGNVTLTSVGVTDPMHGLSTVTCPSLTLSPSASETCTASYTTTQGDVDAGSLTNTGTATATPPTGPAITATSTLKIPALQGPAIGIQKSASIAGYSAAGNSVTYSYLVTNSGNVTLTNVTVSDNELASIVCPDSSLSPSASETCTATYTTTQGDVDAGSLTNTGTATATTPTGSQVTSSSTLTIPAHQNPGITVTKSASITTFSSAGTPVTYGYMVTNTGNVTLTSVGVTDPTPGLSPVVCPVSILAPGASESCTASYTTTQTDVSAGSVTNTGTATGTPPTGPAITATSTLTIAVASGSGGSGGPGGGGGGGGGGCPIRLIKFTPKSATDGTLMTITGQNLSTAYYVYFSLGGASVITATNTQVTVDVAANAVTGPITVWTHACGTVTSAQTFKATSPAITFVSPGSGAVGRVVTIQGDNLKNANQVSFNGTIATIKKDGPTKIVVTVPSGATTGPVSVTTKTGSVTSTQVFTVT